MKHPDHASLLQGTLDLWILKPLTRAGHRQLERETAAWHRIALAIALALDA
jgi:hypothetical protein